MILLALLGVLVSPVALADDDPPPFIPCDNTPLEVVFALLEYPQWFVEQMLSRTDEVAGKAKCTAFKAGMICSEERVAGSPGTPFTTGSAHPHQGLCYEYGATDCDLNEKLRHSRVPNGSGGFVDDHRCVPLDESIPWPF